MSMNITDPRRSSPYQPWQSYIRDVERSQENQDVQTSTVQPTAPLFRNDSISSSAVEADMSPSLQQGLVQLQQPQNFSPEEYFALLTQLLIELTEQEIEINKDNLKNLSEEKRLEQNCYYHCLLIYCRVYIIRAGREL